MDKEKVFKALLARVEESAYYYGVHRNEVWKETLENDKKSILNFFRKQIN